MLPLALFGLTIAFTLIHLLITHEESRKKTIEIFLSYLIFFNIGIMGILVFYAHTFIATTTARSIGWAAGSPFQSELAVANLAFGVLGLLSIWYRGLFWLAIIIGANVFLFGELIVHLAQYIHHHNSAPNNLGLLIWIQDFFIPVLSLTVLLYYRKLSNEW